MTVTDASSRQAVLDAIRAGGTNEQIAEAHGVKPHYVEACRALANKRPVPQRPLTPPAQLQAVPNPTPIVHPVTHPATPAVVAGSIDVLLRQAETSESAAVRRLGVKAKAAVDKLLYALAEDVENAKERQRQALIREQAAAELEKARKRLADAEAKAREAGVLRGRTPKSDRRPAKPRTPAQLEALAKGRAARAAKRAQQTTGTGDGAA